MTRLFKILFLLLVLSITSCAPGSVKTPVSTEAAKGEPTTEDILQNRDISLYDQGGSVDCRESTPEKGSGLVCDEKKIRDFLWVQWSEKRRGYLRIVRNGVDWSSTAHIFVEPKENDSWHIAWRSMSSSALPGGRSVIDDLDLNSIERIENKNGSRDDWHIIIKKASGEIFGQFPDKSK